MKFKLPEDLSVLSIEDLNKLRDEALAESEPLASLSDDEITADQLADFEQLVEAVDTIEARIGEIESEETERVNRLAAARAKLAAQTAEKEEAEADPEPKDEDESHEDPPAAEEEDEAEAEIEKEPVVAAAKPAKKSVALVTRSTKREVEHEKDNESATIIASANVPGYQTGQAFQDLGEVAEAFQARGRGFKSMPSQRAGEAIFERYGVATIKKPDTEFTFENGTLEEQMEFIMNAAKESRLPGGSLIAAGGWCAPSETLYDFCSFETVSGILSLPEITVRRGGINFTKGPDYGTLAATWGFLQTEAQAEANTVKTCYDIACPSFTEVRLDAIGFCVKNGVLTNVGYPELVRRVLEIGAVAHAHKVNAQVLSRISTAIGAAANFVELGSAAADILDAVSLQAEILRYQYALAPGATIEVVIPVWLRNVIRTDLSRRGGVENFISLTDAQVTALFASRGLAVQWVYDWQPLPTSGAGHDTAWPTTVDIMLYPAGAFVKGTSDVISLDTVYDSVGLSTNDYTAAFFEEGLLVANTCGTGRKVGIALTDIHGRVGEFSLPGVATLT